MVKYYKRGFTLARAGRARAKVKNFAFARPGRVIAYAANEVFGCVRWRNGSLEVRGTMAKVSQDVR